MSRVMIVGEAYGADEEAEHAKTGKVSPFVGKSGKLLDGMLKRAGIPRETCFVTNVVNRRPPGNKLESKSHAWWTEGKGKAAKFGCGHFAAGVWFNDYIREGLDALAGDIEREKPEVIVALGNLPLWALTRNDGIAKWRGSELWWQGPLADDPRGDDAGRVPNVGAQAPGAEETGEGGGAPTVTDDSRSLCVVGAVPAETIPVIPTYHPAYVLRVWSWYATVMHDLRKRVVGKLDHPEWREEPAYRFLHQPTFEQVIETVSREILTGRPVASDVETRRGRIACAGFAWSPLDAICIPLMHVDGTRYWSESQERQICDLVGDRLQSAELIGQNFNYDRQYFIADPCFGFTPRTAFDTMIAQHLLYPGTPKDLSHLSSLYCAHHRFWKDEGKEIEGEVDEERWWWYNCIDTVKTFEVQTVQRPMLVKAGFM